MAVKLPGDQARGILHRDQCVRVGRIADHQHAYAAVCDGIERLALGGKDLRIRKQQVLALHARAPRPCADQKCHWQSLKAARRRRSRRPAQRRERAVVQLHDHARERGQRRGDLEQVQVDRLVGAEHLSRRHSKGKCIADLARRTGNRDIDGGSHGFSEDRFSGRPTGSTPVRARRRY
jgi:hypothetical protein